MANKLQVNSDDVHKSISELVAEGQWNVVRDWFEAHPEEIRGKIDPSNGSTILHALCFSTHTPVSLLEFVADTWPEALTIQENKYGATPLHLLCWTLQRNPEKIDVLLKRMKPEDLMIRNRVLGSTVLHSACGSHADISVIKAIIEKHPPVLLAKTFDQHTALYALWNSHLQSIPVHMQIANILRAKEIPDEQAMGELFRRFVAKVNFLAIERFKLSDACPDPQETRKEELSKYILHGLLDMKAPLNALLMTLKMHPESASYPDTEGNFPLHHAVMRRPFRVKYTKLLRELLQAYPEATGKRNVAGDAPIHIAIRERMAWEDGLGEIVEKNCDAVGLVDRQTGLYPVLLSASMGGNVAVNTAFCLLTARPEIVMNACT
mmetsp:Transcript_21704/g.53829  ORF Transcript_21704/g.53829 Transcript_21704/m.53829 type:complete len:378 (+) Transcript_21704:156-1289(+)